jgi:hypothetical protein
LNIFLKPFSFKLSECADDFHHSNFKALFPWSESLPLPIGYSSKIVLFQKKSSKIVLVRYLP